MYGSHDMRHTGIPQVDGGQRDTPGFGASQDVKTNFLNGELEEDIYMQQLKGFIAKGQEHMVCKLHTSIYGLNQASGHGTSSLIKLLNHTVLRKVMMNHVCTNGFKV